MRGVTYQNHMSLGGDPGWKRISVNQLVVEQLIGRRDFVDLRWTWLNRTPSRETYHATISPYLGMMTLRLEIL